MGNNSPFMRRVMDSILPTSSISGAALKPIPDGNMDRLHDGMSDNMQDLFNDLTNLAYIRNPWDCPIVLLPDLEREFGISPNPALTESERRGNLSVICYKHRHSLATAAKLQRALDLAGFGLGGYGLIVSTNSNPATDPSAIVDKSYQLTAHEIGDGDLCAGHSLAFAAQRSGYYLVNGDFYSSSPIYPQAGLVCARAFDGSDSESPKSRAGYYESYVYYVNEFVSPPSGYWPMLFFIGGEVSFNLDGTIAAVSAVWIPSHRRQELHRLVLRMKPLGTWASMIVQYN